MEKYIIIREDKPGFMLQGLGLGCYTNTTAPHLEWTTCEFYAYKAENLDCANAIIDFIRNVIDEYLAEQLRAVPVTL